MKDPNEELDDLLTELDPPYESKDELKVGRVLDHYGIPIFYKQATIIYTEGRNELWKPSFTLYSYGGAVIDYVAGHGEPQQAERLSRDRIYHYNQIPATVSAHQTWTNPTGTRTSMPSWSSCTGRHLTR